jgi:hypothetical protein
MNASHPAWIECARQLREQGYNHTAGNRYAKITGTRRVAWATIEIDDALNHSVAIGDAA